MRQKILLLTVAILIGSFFSGHVFANGNDSKTAKDYTDVGVAYRMKGDNEKAIASFTKAIEIDPSYAEAYECRGISYSSSQIGNLNAALEDFDKAIQLNPADKNFYFGRSLVYFYKQQYDKCWDDIHKAESMGFKTFPPGFIDELKRVSGKNS